MHPLHTDHNLRGAYLHVIADALTSVLAIAALLAGKLYGWTWVDPAMGIVGALLILRWSAGLLSDTAHILLDSQLDARLVARVRRVLERGDDRVTDLHLWHLSPRHRSAVVTLVTHEPQPPDHYKSLLRDVLPVEHVTIEVNGCPAA